MRTLRFLLLSLGLGAVGCVEDPEDEVVSDDEIEQPDYPRSAEPQTTPPSPKEKARHEVRLKHKVPGAKAAFARVLELVSDQYVEGPLSEDEIYTGAIEGVLARLIQKGDHGINRLLSPEELKELHIGTSGQLVGVGIMIETVADVIVIRDSLPGSPAEQSGLKSGDRVLGVDGTRVTGSNLADAVHRIRGESGTTVDLFIQRDTEEWVETVTRGPVKVASADGQMISDEAGYLAITSFTKETTADVEAKLAELTEAGMKGLVLDLRYNPGGVLDSSLGVADLFLPGGLRMLTVRSRGGEEQHFDAEAGDPYEKLPVVALIGPGTASGAEIVAAALAEHGRATLVGEPTFGKSTVEAIHELDGGWAVKLSVSRFIPPLRGHTLGEGVSPDITVAVGDHKFVALRDLRPEEDQPIVAALELLGMRR